MAEPVAPAPVALSLPAAPVATPGVANVSPGPLAGAFPDARERKIAVTGSFSIPLHTSTPPMTTNATGSPGIFAISTTHLPGGTPRRYRGYCPRCGRQPGRCGC